MFCHLPSRSYGIFVWVISRACTIDFIGIVHLALNDSWELVCIMSNMFLALNRFYCLLVRWMFINKITLLRQDHGNWQKVLELLSRAERKNILMSFKMPELLIRPKQRWHLKRFSYTTNQNKCCPKFLPRDVDWFSFFSCPI